MKKLTCVFLTLLVLASLVSAASSAEITLRLGHSLSVGSHYDVYAQEFKSAVERISNGRIQCDVYTDKQLGADREAIESVGLGMHEMVVCASSPITTFDKNFLIFDMPYVVTDRNKAEAFFDGPIVASMTKNLESKGFLILGMGENGFRHVANNIKPMLTPEDLKGVKIRTMESPLQVETFRSLGAYATPMSAGELYIALQQGAVDGQENPLNVFITNKTIEVVKFISLTGHFYTPCLMIISKQFFDSYPKEMQEFIVQAEKEARIAQRKFCKDLDAQMLELIGKEYPRITIDEVDIATWKAASEATYPQLRKILSDNKVDLELLDQYIASQK